MEVALFIWFASVAENFQTLLFITGTVLLVLFAVVTTGTAASRDIYNPKDYPWPITKRVWKFTVAIGLTMLLFAGLTPNQKTLYLMAGVIWDNKSSALTRFTK